VNEPDSTSSHLRQTLTRLHAELSASPQLDDESRRLLSDVLEDIKRLSGARQPAAATHLRSGVEALAVRFEAAHPTLSASLRELIDLLGRAGI
jgi:hypothetical protein